MLSVLVLLGVESKRGSRGISTAISGGVGVTLDSVEGIVGELSGESEAGADGGNGVGEAGGKINVEGVEGGKGIFFAVSSSSSTSLGMVGTTEPSYPYSDSSSGSSLTLGSSSRSSLVGSLASEGMHLHSAVLYSVEGASEEVTGAV